MQVIGKKKKFKKVFNFYNDIGYSFNGTVLMTHF